MAKRKSKKGDEWEDDNSLNAESFEEEMAEVAERDEMVRALAPEMANILSQIHHQLLFSDLHERLIGQPNGKSVYDRLEAIINKLDEIENR